MRTELIADKTSEEISKVGEDVSTHSEESQHFYNAHMYTHSYAHTNY